MNMMEKNKTKLALISLYTQDNVGIVSIASYLLSKGKEVINIYFVNQDKKYKNRTGHKQINPLIDLLQEENVGLVGISFVSTFYKDAIYLAKVIRENAGMKIIFGGWHPTLCPDECLPYADMVCIGEGEETLLEVIDKLEKGSSPESVRGIWFKDNGRVIKNQHRPLIKDLDVVYSTFDFKKFKSYVYLNNKISLLSNQHNSYGTVAAKGCPFSCTYCNTNTLHELAQGPSEFLRKRSIDNVIDELIKAKEFYPNLKGIRFNNEVFPYFGRELDEFCQKYNRYIRLPFIAYLHFNFINDNVLKKLKESGLSRLELGVQSGSERFRREVFNRRETNNKILEVTRLARRLAFPFKYDIILSPLLDTEESLKESIYFFLELGRDVYLKLLGLIYLPKTVLTEGLLKKGLIKESDQEQYAQNVLKSWHFNFLILDIRNELTYFYYIIFLIRRTHLPDSFYRYLVKNKNIFNLFAMIFVILSYCIGRSLKLFLKYLFIFIKKPNRHNLSLFVRVSKEAVFFLKPLVFSNAE